MLKIKAIANKNINYGGLIKKRGRNKVIGEFLFDMKISDLKNQDLIKQAFEKAYDDFGKYLLEGEHISLQFLEV